MDTSTSTDSDTAEQNDVFRTLSEQQMSMSELVRNVFSQVQAEFSTWNADHCYQVLRSFTAPSTWRSCLHPDLRLPSLAAIPSSFPDAQLPVALEASSPLPLISQEVYSPNGVVIATSSMRLEIVHLSSSLEPHPLYELCSPLHRSVFKGDDSDNMDFIPYADDHAFDQINHTHHYESLSWRNVVDPDLEVVVFEVVYRLQARYALTYDEIEECNVLPLSLRPRPGIPGLLSTARRRDRLHWTGNTIPMSYTFPPSTRPEGSDLRNRLRTLSSLFCPNMGCVEPLCSVHMVPNPMPLEPEPSSLDKPDEVLSPCRNKCFVDTMNKEASSWDEADLDVLRVIFEMSPSATPCDLAELCLKPCFEVFYYRTLLHPRSPKEVLSESARTRRRMVGFNDKDPMQFTPNDPCRHDGPCNSSSSCPCFENKSHCQRNCRCSAECDRRWQGCRCIRTRLKWGCVTEKCPCVEAFRECDPELCVNCKCTVDDIPCRNSQIQYGAHKKLEVKRSEWGLGAFLAEPAKAGDLITEYVGEIIYEPTVESRADLAAHRRRCYVFGLNDTFSLDATYAGNISRFIDHSEAGRSKRINSRALVRLVNGDHRIGIFALRDMEPGSQVLINYGSLFFE